MTFGKQRYRLALELHVIDNGPGVPDPIRDRIFYPLVSWREGCSGLGLTLAKSLIDAMGGALSLHSQIGRGTCISIRLLLTHAPADAAITASLVTQTTVATGQVPLHILVVDDIAINREILCRWLDHHGHQATEAANGEEALQRAIDKRFDIILIDIDLPGISGRDAARMIRSSGGRSANSTMIAVSGHAFAQDVADSLACGIDMHISKPIDFNALLTLIGQISMGQDLRRGLNTAAS